MDTSPQALRAAEALEAEYDLSNGSLEYQVPFVAEIIERETGAGEARRLIDRMRLALDFHGVSERLEAEARAFLAKHPLS